MRVRHRGARLKVSNFNEFASFYYLEKQVNRDGAILLYDGERFIAEYPKINHQANVRGKSVTQDGYVTVAGISYPFAVRTASKTEVPA